MLALYGLAVTVAATWRRLTAWRFRRARNEAAAAAAAFDLAQEELSAWALRIANAPPEDRKDMTRVAAVARLEADEAAARYRRATGRQWRLCPAEKDSLPRPRRLVLPYLAGLADGGGLALLAYWRQGGSVLRLASDLLLCALEKWLG